MMSSTPSAPSAPNTARYQRHDDLAAMSDAEVRLLLLAWGDAIREQSRRGQRTRARPKGQPRDKMLRVELQAYEREARMLEQSLRRLAVTMSRQAEWVGRGVGSDASQPPPPPPPLPPPKVQR